MGTDQIDIEKKTITKEEDKTTTTTTTTTTRTTLTAAHQFIAVTQKVFLTILLWLRTHVCLIVGTLRLFMFYYAIRKVFEFFLFDRTLFRCCLSHIILGGATNETQ